MASLQKLEPILYCVQQACIQMSLSPPTGVYDSRDDNALLMGSVANLAGIMIGDAYEWQALRKSLSFNGDNVRTNYDLPADFSRFVDETGWSTANRRPVIVINPQSAAAIAAWVSRSFFVNPACRIMGNQLVFMTPPAAGDVITFEYIDANWVIDGADNSLTKQKLTINADIPRFDWLLMVLAIKVKWLAQKGMANADAQSDFNDRLLQLTQRDVMAQTLTLSGPVPGGYRYLDGTNAGDTGFGM